MTVKNFMKNSKIERGEKKIYEKLDPKFEIWLLSVSIALGIPCLITALLGVLYIMFCYIDSHS